MNKTTNSTFYAFLASIAMATGTVGAMEQDLSKSVVLSPPYKKITPKTKLFKDFYDICQSLNNTNLDTKIKQQLTAILDTMLSLESINKRNKKHINATKKILLKQDVTKENIQKPLNILQKAKQKILFPKKNNPISEQSDFSLRALLETYSNDNNNYTATIHPKFIESTDIDTLTKEITLLKKKFNDLLARLLTLKTQTTDNIGKYDNYHISADDIKQFLAQQPQSSDQCTASQTADTDVELFLIHSNDQLPQVDQSTALKQEFPDNIGQYESYNISADDIQQYLATTQNTPKENPSFFTSAWNYITTSRLIITITNLWSSFWNLFRW